MRPLRGIVIAAVLSALMAGATPAAAQAWPSKPVKLVNGYPAGGGADILARPVAEKLTAALGQQVIVENRTGATGMIAAQSVAASTPDGYTVLLYTMSMCCTSPVMPGNTVSIDPDKDLMPVVRIASLDNLLYVGAHMPFKTVKDVIEGAKARPGTLTYGSSGVGGSYYLWAALFTTLAGIDMLHVPFRGGPPAIAERLNAEVRKMVADKEFAEKLASMGYQPIGDTMATMKAAIQSDRAKWEKVIRATGIRAE